MSKNRRKYQEHAEKLALHYMHWNQEVLWAHDIAMELHRNENVMTEEEHIMFTMVCDFLGTCSLSDENRIWLQHLHGRVHFQEV